MKTCGNIRLSSGDLEDVLAMVESSSKERASQNKKNV